MDGGFGLGSVVWFEFLAPPNEPGLVQVGVAGGAEAGAGRVVRARPVLTPVVEVAQLIEIFLPAWREGVECLVCREFYPGDDEVQFMVSGVAVPDPEYVILVGLQTGECQALEVVHQLLFLLWGDCIFRPPGTDAGGEFPFAVLGVDDVAGHVRVAA